MQRRTRTTTEPLALMPYVWSYGMGAESTAGILRMLTDPTARPDTIAPDFSNLVLVIAQTGDEWSTTGRLVQHYILPLLRKHNVRLVEVARRGPTKKDGVAVLQDTRQPYRLHLDGVYKLSRENRVTGTMPQLGGVRKCSQKAKGAPQDAWRANEFGDSPYIHALGFNVHEATRITRDSAYSMGGQRIPTYPIYEWGWTRQDCLDYLYRKLGVAWPKSCCRHCLLSALLPCLVRASHQRVTSRDCVALPPVSNVCTTYGVDLLLVRWMGVLGCPAATGHPGRHACPCRRRLGVRGRVRPAVGDGRQPLAA